MWSHVFEHGTFQAKARKNILEMRTELEKAEAMEEVREQAIYFAENVIPLMTGLREASDALENLVSDELWPIPKYREMLFMR